MYPGILFDVQEQGTKFLSRKILENIDAGRQYDCIFFLTCLQLRFFKCNWFWFWVLCCAIFNYFICGYKKVMLLLVGCVLRK